MLTKNNILALSDEAKKRPAFWVFWVSRLRGFAVGALVWVGLWLCGFVLVSVFVVGWPACVCAWSFCGGYSLGGQRFRAWRSA